MFEIFVYLFENYYNPEACPAPDQLARKLSAAGFEEDEISDALEWLSGLAEASQSALAPVCCTSNSVRCFDEHETAKLGPQCRGFLLFLENAGVLNAASRELIIERAMALAARRVSLSRFKVIVLMVLWQRRQEMDTLILEELLSDGGRALH
ncbi:MAG: DUF494 domain-containing protein [Betaproteobacteria bacterium]|nr:DUF494 domain-containing protein [Betaproteobacteria bacterium]